mgnify:CR=1 FL=1
MRSCPGASTPRNCPAVWRVPEGSEMRVLVVEDDPDLADALVRRLRRQGHAVDWQNDGQAAAHVLGYQPFDLLLLDIGLPGLDAVSYTHLTLPTKA